VTLIRNTIALVLLPQFQNLSPTGQSPQTSVLWRPTAIFSSRSLCPLAILDEMADVLVRKFDACRKEISDATAIVRAAARTVTPAVEIDVIKDDAVDNRILECAVSAGADYIVTGDKDLLRLGSCDSIQIVKVSDFLKIAQGQGQPR
jgi:putative PIN family toxin of toxin-antitoxin system